MAQVFCCCIIFSYLGVALFLNNNWFKKKQRNLAVIFLYSNKIEQNINISLYFIAAYAQIHSKLCSQSVLISVIVRHGIVDDHR